MRNVAVAVLTVLSLVACHKSYTDGARSLGSKFKKLGTKVAKVAPVDVDVGANVDVAAIAKSQARHRVANVEPITIDRSSRRTSSVDSKAAPSATTPTVEPTITRRTVDTGADQVWKNMFRAGAKASCEKAADFDSCSATCSEHLRRQSMQQLAPNAGKPVQCECTQGYNRCS